ncbi:uncharacterized protein A1O9_03792 [Exophiala aquamarina CBS 119918]|uniref:Ketoreductase domain-containing protein n=1 Tax=Exophiala aquamarina CBS 119918 TaxID=1182545 RepID=A0A072PFQ1_9EURO|nr:uncharacterized protein A1O9_03792 [Exophiala aquamarina CBS 119918]KEF58949.1 hypothetical protein A1O9_03792 [Exophiala aquamarina CBS 119918]
MKAITHEKGAQVPSIKVYANKYLDHVIVVTGAASGIGKVTAHLFAEQGADVVLFDIDEPNIKDVQSSILQQGGKAEIQVCDVSDDGSVNKAIDATIQRFGKIDVLINLAGTAVFSPLERQTTENYQQVISTNLDGGFFLTRAVLPHMRKARYGRIIHTSSSTTGNPAFGLAPYVASKAGIIGLVRASAVEAGPGITVNALLPGLTDFTKVAETEQSSLLFDSVLARQAIKRRGHPLDMAHALSFIASPEAAFFTGQAFECSGGESFR